MKFTNKFLLNGHKTWCNVHFASPQHTPPGPLSQINRARGGSGITRELSLQHSQGITCVTFYCGWVSEDVRYQVLCLSVYLTTFLWVPSKLKGLVADTLGLFSTTFKFFSCEPPQEGGCVILYCGWRPNAEINRRDLIMTCGNWTPPGCLRSIWL